MDVHIVVKHGELCYRKSLFVKRAPSSCPSIAVIPLLPSYLSIYLAFRLIKVSLFLVKQSQEILGWDIEKVK
jgi:hypothetical protein